VWYNSHIIRILIFSLYYMEKKHIIVSTIILVLIVVGMFIFTYLKKVEMQEEQYSTTQQKSDTNTTSPYDTITRIDAKHFFIDGTHTIVGEIEMPTPCDLLNWDTRILESNPEQVIVDFTVINHTDICADVVTPQRFSVSFVASEQVIIRATIQGREIDVNLIPAQEGETPEDFELFIKG
jgi:hypothetical protein